MKKGQNKNTPENKKKSVSNGKNTAKASSSSKKTTGDNKTPKKTVSSSTKAQNGKSNGQLGDSSISKERKTRGQKTEENQKAQNQTKKTLAKSPEENANLNRRRNALKSATEISEVKKAGKSLKKEDGNKLENAKIEKNNISGSVRKGRGRKLEEDEPIQAPAEIEDSTKHIVKKTQNQTRKKSLDSNSDKSNSNDEDRSRASREKKTLEKTIKQQLTSNVDTSQISDEISRIIKRIEEKRKRVGGPREKRTISRTKKTVAKRDKASTADLYQGNLQINKDIKVEHICDIMDLTRRQNIQKVDVLLAIIEIALNSTYYSLSTFNRSKSFWEDVMKYKELKKIFEPLKPETLKKYWININLNFGDPLQPADFFKKNRKIFDDSKIAILPMISTAAAYSRKEINNLEEYVKAIPREPMRTDYNYTETIDSVTGKVKTEKRKTMTTVKRARAEPITRRFMGNTVSQIVHDNIDEIIEGTKAKRDSDEEINANNLGTILEKIEMDEENRRNFIMDLKEEEQKNVFSINDEDKFIFKSIEDVVNKMNKIFPNYSDAFILESLKGNSFNIFNTFKYLKDPKRYTSSIFTEVDDEVIRNMRNSDYYTKLCDEKGKSQVELRQEYLNA